MDRPPNSQIDVGNGMQIAFIAEDSFPFPSNLRYENISCDMDRFRFVAWRLVFLNQAPSLIVLFLVILYCSTGSLAMISLNTIQVSFL